MHNDKQAKQSLTPVMGESIRSESGPQPHLNGAEALGISPSLALKIARKRWPFWIMWDLVVFGLVSLLALFAYPQNYSATVSISMQQPTQSSSALAALTGNTAKKYTGVLKSRSFAEKVDAEVHFRELMNLKPTRKSQIEAIDKVIKDLRVDDNAADGLLYVTVNLTGPPRLWPDPGGVRRKQLGEATARAANLYSSALQNYLKYTDTDKEIALLRGADSQVVAAQKSYYDSMEQLLNYVRHTRITMIPTGGSSGGSDSSGGGGQVGGLLSKRAELEAKMKATDAVLSKTRELLTDKSQNLTSLPEEDPLLVVARRQVIEAQANVDRLEITFGGSMQSVRRAKEILKLAQQQLQKEISTILRGKTSDQLRRQAMQAEYETVERQIAGAKENYQYNRNVNIELERRRNEVTLKLESLKAILTRYAELKMQTVSAQNRMAIIDSALPPVGGTPGIALLLSVAALAALFFVALLWTIEYLVKSQKMLSQELLVRE